MDWTRRNIPNLLSLARLAGTPVLYLLVHREPVGWFVAGYALIGFTDFLDGYLARAWNLTSAFGSKLDSVADVVFYLSTAYFAVALFPQYVLPNRAYIAACVVLLVVQVVASRLLVGRVLTPHTHLSRAAGLLAVAVFFLSFLLDTTWLLRGVLLLYCVAFVEMVLMFAVRPDVGQDMRSVLSPRGEGAKPDPASASRGSR